MLSEKSYNYEFDNDNKETSQLMGLSAVMRRVNSVWEMSLFPPHQRSTRSGRLTYNVAFITLLASSILNFIVDLLWDKYSHGYKVIFVPEIPSPYLWEIERPKENFKNMGANGEFLGYCIL